MNDAAGVNPKIDEVAAEWIARRGSSWTEDDERALAKWRALDVRHEEAYERMSRTWAMFDRAQDKGLNPLLSVRLLARSSARRRRRTLAAGGVLVLTVLLCFQARHFRSPAAVPAPAEHAMLPVQKLPDGSFVELNTNARISVLYDAHQRGVRLEQGEVHFRVEKDPRPFVVQAGELMVKAVGTAFTVQLAPTAVEVVVTEGRIALEPRDETAAAPGAAPGQVVSAGNRVMFPTAIAAGVIEVTPMTESQLARRLAWRTTRLAFEGTELAEAAAQMNAYNRLQIRVPETAVGRLRVSGVFHADNPRGFVRIIAQTFGLEAEWQGESEIVLRQP